MNKISHCGRKIDFQTFGMFYLMLFNSFYVLMNPGILQKFQFLAQQLEFVWRIVDLSKWAKKIEKQPSSKKTRFVNWWGLGPGLQNVHVPSLISLETYTLAKIIYIWNVCSPLGSSRSRQEWANFACGIDLCHIANVFKVNVLYCKNNLDMIKIGLHLISHIFPVFVYSNHCFCEQLAKLDSKTDFQTTGFDFLKNEPVLQISVLF